MSPLLNTPISHYPIPPVSLPICWTIAGSDSGGGAGIQADLKTFQGLGVYGCSVLTALTAQNTLEVAAMADVPEGLITSQLLALHRDLPPAAIKIGMLGSATAVKVVAEYLKALDTFVVCDPVLAATAGGDLLAPAARSIFVEELLPRVDLLTPNLHEAASLCGRRVETSAQIQSAARVILGFGVKSVLIKGGHAQGEFCQDYWTDGVRPAWLSSPRLGVRDTHGGGCTLSAAIAAGVAQGLPELDAVVLARAYTHQGLRLAGGVGHGRGPIGHGGWPSDPADLPWLTATAAEVARRPLFPPLEPGPLGLYPVVDRAAWVARLAALGVRAIQIRIKDLAPAARRRELKAAAAAAARHGARLFVNDDWKAALALQAYGVHLGQDDLDGADLRALARAGLRLGVSTHGYAEVARALAVRPSYVAIGTIFASPSKAFAQAPMGVPFFARLRKLVPCPVVAIGGLTLERAPELRAAGADGLAVISDITRAPDPEARVRAWLEAWK